MPASGILPAYAPVSSLDVGKDRAIHSIVLTPYDYWFLEGLDVYAADFQKMGMIEQVVANPDTGRHHLLVAGLPRMPDFCVPASAVQLVGEDRVVLDQTAAEIQRRVARFTVPLGPVGDEPKPGLDC